MKMEILIFVETLEATYYATYFREPKGSFPIEFLVRLNELLISRVTEKNSA
jgi:hypothetical protein